MEQIKRKGDVIYYGQHKCKSPDEAYVLLRDAYHAGLGKRVYHKLNRSGRRERIHGYGFVLRKAARKPEGIRGGSGETVRYRILGILDIAYCRIVGINDMHDVSEEEFDGYLDWLFEAGKGRLRLVGRKDGVGRTDKRLKKKYR